MKKIGYLMAGLGLFLAVIALELATSRSAGGQQTGGLPALAKQVKDLQDTVQEQAGKIEALENKTQYVSVSDGEMFVHGTNLHVVNGLGTTDQVNGLGNLIVGYNESGGGTREGSHNVVIGSYHAYGSFAGLVVGQANGIYGPFACVTGGLCNSATEYGATVSGGSFNTASGAASVVSGGDSNTATIDGASVSGGLGIVQDTAYGWSAGSQGGAAYNGTFRSP